MEDVNVTSSKEECQSEFQLCNLTPVKENTDCSVSEPHLDDYTDETQDAECLEPLDKSDGSDSGIGSDISDDRLQRELPDPSDVEVTQSVTYNQVKEKSECSIQEDSKDDFPPTSHNHEEKKSEDYGNIFSGGDSCSQPAGESELIDSPIPDENKMGIRFPSISKESGENDAESEKCKASSVSPENNNQEVSDNVQKRSSLKRRTDNDSEGPQCKKKKSIIFDKVTVFYFPRAQGFTCVPSQVSALFNYW